MLAAPTSIRPFQVLPITRERRLPERTLAARRVRVAILLVACALFSLADLEMTLLYATTGGMVEVNPIARLIMASNQPLAVIAFKVATACFGLVVLYKLRHLRYAEYGAWVCFFALAWLSARWFTYASEVEQFDHEAYTYMAEADPRFIQMSP